MQLTHCVRRWCFAYKILSSRTNKTVLYRAVAWFDLLMSRLLHFEKRSGTTGRQQHISGAAHTHLLKELGVDMDAGVDSGWQRLDRPRRVQWVDPHVQRIQFLQGEHLVPCRAQLEQTLSGVLIHLQTKDMTWSTTNSWSRITPQIQLLQLHNVLSRYL